MACDAQVATQQKGSGAATAYLNKATNVRLALVARHVDSMTKSVSKISSLEATVSKLDERTKLFTSAEALEAARKAAADIVEGAQAAAESLQADINELKKSLATADTQLKAKQADIKTLTTAAVKAHEAHEKRVGEEVATAAELAAALAALAAELEVKLKVQEDHIAALEARCCTIS